MEEKKIDFAKLEKKWQNAWEKKKAFVVSEKSKKKKYYVLEMYAYPSATGLHMGHAFNFTIGDILARYMRMKGNNVLYPTGYDSFGLPAENAAIKADENPKNYIDNAINNFVRQQKALGFSYDWTRMLYSHDPEYYKWNQYFFLQFLKKGLAYRKRASVNFCAKCNSVLANEQVHNGKCWRHGDTEVEIRQLEQWFLKTTDYAQELLDKIDSLDWPERIKSMQKNWIGRSEGSEIMFEIKGNISNVVVVHGCPSNEKDNFYNKHWMPWIKSQLINRGVRVETPLMPTPWNAEYNEWKKEFEKINVDEHSVLIGHSCGGAFLVRWLGETNTKIKKLILVAPAKKLPGLEKKHRNFYDFKTNKRIKENISEIVIFVSNDESPGIKQSVKLYSDEFGVEPTELKNRGHFTEEDMGTKEFPELLDEIVEKWPIFTTRADTLMGVTFMVISAGHPRLMDIVADKQKKEVEKFVKKIRSTKQEDMDKLDKEGVFTGVYAIHPITGEKIPVWAGNFVVADYGSGMVMAVPAHDQRDFEFAKKYKIPIKVVIEDNIKVVTITSALKPEFYKGVGKFAKIINRGGLSHIYTNKVEEVFDMAKDNFIGNLWYIHSEGKIKKIMFHTKGENKIFNWDTEKEREEAKEYGRRIGVKKEQLDFNELREAYTGAGILVNSEDFDGLYWDEGKEHITKFLEEKKLGKKTIQYKLRDWLVSRQRYWGTPIPVIHCDKCGIVPVPEKELPVLLPEKVKFGIGNPLETNDKFVNVKCPKCKGKARRETDTMDTFFDSSWYYLRFADNKNKKIPFDKKDVNYWMPTDFYVGGAEHATMHLIYARFFTKALRDMGFAKIDEPFKRLYNQGMIHGDDGKVMSKSAGNGIDPLEISNKYGADALRMFLVSVASPDRDFTWSTAGVESVSKVISKIYSLKDIKFGKSSKKFENKLNKTIKEIERDMVSVQYNQSIIRIRTLVDSFEGEVSKDDFGKFVRLITPFVPHVAEDLWSKIGGRGFVSLADWPEYDEKKIDEKFEQAEEAVEKTFGDIQNILRIVKEKTGKEGERVYLYVIPSETDRYDEEELGKRLGLEVKVYAVNEKAKIDPEGKAGKARPGKPGIYVE